MRRITLLIFLALAAVTTLKAQPDPNFHIYLCIGQSNMEAGARPVDEEDKLPVDSRFQFMAAADMPRYERVMGQWYDANPPINRQTNYLGPVDFFGRTMVKNMPGDYRIGVINVSVAGAKIELWDKENYKTYLDGAEKWMQRMCEDYEGNPYQRLVDMARLAQKDGVIKGLLIHQGESNSDDRMWPRKVRGIYDNLCKDLDLNPEEFFVLAGELKYKNQNGVCYAFNSEILPTLVRTIPNSYIISAEGVEGQKDPWHFTDAGMKELGTRYAIKALELMGFPYTGKPASNDSRFSTFTLDLKPESLGIEILPTFNGIFYEDINQSNDGGISAQMIQNNSFQAYNVPFGDENEFSKDPAKIYGWTPVFNGGEGSATITDEAPLVEYPKYYDFDPDDEYDDGLKYRQYSVKFEITKPGYGIAANGFGIAPYVPSFPRTEQKAYYSTDTQVPSLAVEKDVTYELGLYLKASKYKGGIKVYLENAKGELNSNVFEIKKINKNWKQYTSALKALRSEDSRLVILADKTGSFYLDFVTLVPEAKELWKEGRYGAFRKDILTALEELKPTFMRFPGGCASEGTNYWGQVFWKNSVGPVTERIGFRNHWGYWTSQYIGFYEYMLMAEGLGAKAIPVLNNGVTCQFAGHSYIAPLETEADKQRFHDIYVNDALHFIEFCNGDASSSEWGRLRAQMGHPEPFGLEYLSIGNENQGDEFWERFDIMYQEIKAKYPEITVITTAGSAAQGKEFDTNYHIIDTKYPDTIVDEHYYMSDEWFFLHRDRYEASMVRGADGLKYDRERPTRVFIGEFANNRTNNAFASTLAEAAYYTGLERNADMVAMAAYAPLLCKKGYNKWNSNLIWFDNRGLWRTSNYYYMKIFSNNMGDRIFESSPVMKNSTIEDSKVYTSTSIDTETGNLFVKIVNAEAISKELKVNVSGGKPYIAEYEYIASDDLDVRNQKDQNYYSSNPDIKDFNYDEAVTPRTESLGAVASSFTVLIPANSVGVIRLSAE